MTTWLDGTTTARAASNLEARLDSRVFNVMSPVYGAKGDGVTDDAAAIQAALTAAQAVGGVVYFPTRTYLVGTTITITAALLLQGNGATIKKAVALNGYAVDVSGNDVSVRELNIDGNRVGGNGTASGCIRFYGLRCRAYRLKASNGSVVGIAVQDPGGTLDAFECEASDIQTTLTTGDGFQVAGTGAVLRAYQCKANGNGANGFNILASAGDGCHIDGEASNNLNRGVYISNNNGSVGRLLLSNNQHFGLVAENCIRWSVDYVETRKQGANLLSQAGYVADLTATGVSLTGCVRWRFGSLASFSDNGYGINISQIGAVGCTYCTFEDIYVETAGDPAVFVGGGSSYNSFASIVAVGCTLAVSFSEGVAGNNNDNAFGFVHAVACYAAVIAGSASTGNTFDFVKATDYTQSFTYTSWVWWQSGATNNTINYFEAHNPGSTAPNYLMKCDAAATGNRVLSGVLASQPVTGLLNDSGATNRVSLTGVPATTQQAANYTLVATDAGTVIEGTQAGAQTVTVPPNASVAFPIGTRIRVVQMGAGQITLTPGAAVTIRTARTLTTRALYSVVEVQKRGTDEWVASGDLT